MEAIEVGGQAREKAVAYSRLWRIAVWICIGGYRSSKCLSFVFVVLCVVHICRFVCRLYLSFIFGFVCRSYFHSKCLSFVFVVLSVVHICRFVCRSYLSFIFVERRRRRGGGLDLSLKSSNPT